jgi:hypothetical protein
MFFSILGDKKGIKMFPSQPRAILMLKMSVGIDQKKNVASSSSSFPFSLSSLGYSWSNASISLLFFFFFFWLCW